MPFNFETIRGGKPINTKYLGPGDEVKISSGSFQDPREPKTTDEREEWARVLEGGGALLFYMILKHYNIFGGREQLVIDGDVVEGPNFTPLMVKSGTLDFIKGVQKVLRYDGTPQIPRL